MALNPLVTRPIIHAHVTGVNPGVAESKLTRTHTKVKFGSF